MARFKHFISVAIFGLLSCGCTVPLAHALDLEIVGENVLDGKKVYAVALEPINPRLTTRYWAAVGDSDSDGGIYPTLEVGWVRRPDVHYFQVLVFWRTSDPTKLSGQVFEHGNKNLVDLQFINDEKQSVLSLNLKNVAEENIGRIQRVVLRYDHSRVRQKLDSDIEEWKWSPAAVLNARAWYLATFPVDAVRDGNQALADAARAVHLSDVPGYRDTLAAAYAENKDFDNAIREQRLAIESLNRLEKTGRAERDRGEVDDSQYQAFVKSIELARREFQVHLDRIENRQPVRAWDYPPY
jgi:hypothetical protein